jgi:hypothetical protein
MGKWLLTYCTDKMQINFQKTFKLWHGKGFREPHLKSLARELGLTVLA